MHVVAPEKASTCRSKCAKGEWIEKVTITSLRLIAWKKNLADGGGGRL